MKYAGVIILAVAAVLVGVSASPCSGDTIHMKDGTKHTGKIMVETGTVVLIRATVEKDGAAKKITVRLARKDIEKIVRGETKPPTTKGKTGRPKTRKPAIKRRPVKKRPRARLPVGPFKLGRIRRSVVLIRNIIHNRTYAIGSGFIVREDGVIYTNRHVIEVPKSGKKSAKLLVGVPSRRDPDTLEYFHAKVALMAPEKSGLDFAVLRIVAGKRYGRFPVIKVSSTGSGLGQSVAVLGFPDNLGESPTLSFTKGSISSANVKFQKKSYLQTDAAVNPGNSGGPMVNTMGQAIGLVTMRMTRADNMAYALRLEEVESTAKTALAKAETLKPEAGPIPKKLLAKIDTMMAPSSQRGATEGWILEAGRRSESTTLLRIGGGGLDYWVTSERTLPEDFRLTISCWVMFEPASTKAIEKRTIRLLCVRTGVEDTTLPVRRRNGWTVWSNHKTTGIYHNGDEIASRDQGNPGLPMDLTIVRQAGKYTISMGPEEILTYQAKKHPKGRYRFSLGGYQSRMMVLAVSVTDLSEKPRTLPEDLEGLSKALESEDWAMRNDAVVSLGRLGTESIPVLLKAAEDENSSVRERAVEYLGKLAADEKGKSHVPEVLKIVKLAINDESLIVRRSGLRAVRHLGSAADDLAIDVVKAANLKPKPNSASTRLVALGAIQSIAKACLPELVKSICRRDPISEAARGIIREMADDAVPAIIEAFPDAEKEARIDLIRILQPLAATEKRVGDLMETVLEDDEDWEVRQAAVQYLGIAKTDRIGALVINALKDKHPDVQKASINILLSRVRGGDEKAALALSGIATEHVEWKTRLSVISELIKRDSKKFMPMILKALGDRNSKIRMLAIKWLAERSDLTKESIPALTAALDDESDDVRHSAVSALSRIKSADVIPALTDVLNDPGSKRAKGLVAAALCKHGSSGMAAVLTAAKDPDSAGRDMSLQALSNLKPLPTEAVEIFTELLDSPKASARQMALGTLSRTPSPSEDLVKAFMKRLSDTDKNTARMAVTAVKKCGAAAVPGLIELLGSKSIKVRKTAVRCLKNMRSKLESVVPDLRKAYLKETDKVLRADIVRLFDGIDTNAATKVLHTALLDKSTSVSEVAMGILRGTGEPLIPMLKELLESDEEETRYKGVRLLDRLGSAKALSTLETALDDEALKVRVNAAVILARRNRATDKLAGILAEGLVSKDDSMAHGSRESLHKLKDRAVPALEKAMASDSVKVAYKSLETLGEIKTEKALDAVETALTHDAPTMRAKAAWIIGRSRGATEELAPYIIEYAINTKRRSRDVCRILKKLGAKAIPHLSKAFENPNENKRLLVFYVVRDFYTYKSSIPLLQKATEDKNRTIRASGRRYLEMARSHQKRQRKRK